MTEGTSVPTYSHSKLETFRHCPLKFKFRYIDCIETGIVGIEAFMASRVHEALEKLYSDVSPENGLPLSQLLAFYESCWRQNWHGGVRIVKSNMTESHYFDSGVACIRNYYRENSPFNQTRTVALEHHVVFNLDNRGTRLFQGYVDRISSRPDGTFEIHDYKTSRSIPSLRELSDAIHKDGVQLSLYQIAVKSEHPDAISMELVWHYLSRGVTLRLRRNEHDLARILRNTVQLIERIESTKTFAANKSQLCSWCEYKETCPAWQ
jgi:putative RecB family exonuclease